MNEKLNHSLLIEQYISGEMDEEQARNFLLRLKEDKDLAAEFKFEQELSDAISDENTLELRRKLIKILQESKKRTGILHYLSSRPYQIAAAASIIVLLTTAYLVFLMPHKPTTERLFSSYYDSDQPLRITKRSGTDLVEALRNYQDKDFLNAIDQFNLILQADSNNSAVRFYTSLCYIETGQFDQAIAYLSAITQNHNSLYQKPSEWYLGLCYLKMNHTDQAVDLFRQIADDKIHDYQQDAKQILREIDRMK